MSGIVRGFLASLFAALLILPLRAAPPGNLLTGRILLLPKPGVTSAQIEPALAEMAVRSVGEIGAIGVQVVQSDPARLAETLNLLGRHPLVAFAEADTLIGPAVDPDDPDYPNAWHLPNVSAPAAWDLVRGNPAVVIAVLDSGIDNSHPDLTAKVVKGWNCFDNTSDTSDVTGHGTSVAGAAAAATDNGIGVAGVAWNCGIMPIRVTDLNGYASISALAYGLTYAADNGARVANVSFRASGSATVQTAADYFRSKGGVVTVSAGNESLFDPSADNPAVLTISSTGPSDLLSGFSNTGTKIDLAAPGEGISTTTMGGGYGFGTGTSFSAPVVAGVAALVISANPALSAGQIEQVLKASADDLGEAGWDPSFGAGRVNARAAVELALGSPGGGSATPDTTAPVTSITAPSDGSTLSGTTAVTVTATDDRGVARVEWYLNGSLMESSSGTPVSFIWDTRTSADGIATLVTKAFDAAGNSGTSAPLTVTVQNTAPADTTAPQVLISSPAPGSRLGRLTRVTVAASDDVGVAFIALYVDGKLYATSTSSPATFNWNTSKLPGGAHTVQASASDAAGNVARSTVIPVYK